MDQLRREVCLRLSPVPMPVQDSRRVGRAMAKFFRMLVKGVVAGVFRGLTASTLRCRLTPITLSQLGILARGNPLKVATPLQFQ